ncbi:cytochrome P450 [Suillus discolor]|uniref:Cytochrome P450 n=1 Tax=Suillus discolor TaxID=1912936 RepID=A0A9P7FLD7_9AGAM|nr:cytochrome P450 [Suillus discolor]KAG2119776.1 cytochrome P450 [Suillus discolor]
MVPAVHGHFAILAGFSLSFAAVTALRRFIKKRQHNPSLPPGSVPLPLLGNVLSVDSQEPWLTSTERVAAYDSCLSVVMPAVFDYDIGIFTSNVMLPTYTNITQLHVSTEATWMVFVLAMVLYPDFQKRAQAKINSVVGKDRLPTLEDRASLPYIDAVLRETLRWGITRNEKRYPDASRFIPERLIDVDGALTNDDLAQYIFGFGPWRYTADAFVRPAIVTMLATLDISSVKDDQGKVISFTPTFIT